MSRSIEHILHFRSDISPFLVHLTRDSDGHTANDKLSNIISEQCLRQGQGKISDVRFAIKDIDWKPAKIRRYFSAICFTETPLNEIHCFLDIERRKVELQPYGLVFVKDNLLRKGVSPTLYINNYTRDKDSILQELCKLIERHDAREAAKLLPLISVFGARLTPVGGAKYSGVIDFMWEREWRFPYYMGDFSIDPEDIFVGLCPHDEIDRYETEFRKSFNVRVPFVDPTRNMKWYATKLIAARRRHNLKDSVV